jgi:hypothetical protein
MQQRVIHVTAKRASECHTHVQRNGQHNHTPTLEAVARRRRLRRMRLGCELTLPRLDKRADLLLVIQHSVFIELMSI